MGVQKEMTGGRNYQAIVDALETMAQVMAQANQALHSNQNQNGGVDEFRELEKFQKNNPPLLRKTYNDDYETHIMMVSHPLLGSV